MADYKSCKLRDSCPMAKKFGDQHGVKLDCSKCKDYISTEYKCGDCEYYDKRDAYCGKKHESRFFRENTAACGEYKQTDNKRCYTCKHWICGWACKALHAKDCGDDLKFWEPKKEKQKTIKLGENKSESDAVNPNHYKQGGIECIDCIKAALGDNFIGFLMGNVIKYSYRYKDKNGIEDLQKARWYLDKAIAELTEKGDADNGK